MSSSFVDDHFQFAEMNIRHTGNMDETIAMVRRAVRMGYDCVVINTDIGQMMQEDINLVSLSSRSLRTCKIMRNRCRHSNECLCSATFHIRYFLF